MIQIKQMDLTGTMSKYFDFLFLFLKIIEKWENLGGSRAGLLPMAQHYPRWKRGLTNTMRQRTPVPLIEVALLRQLEVKYIEIPCFFAFLRNGSENDVL